MGSLQLSSEQYQALLKLAYLGNWVVNGSKLPDDVIPEYEDLQSHLFSKAKQFGLERLTSSEGDAIYPSPLFENDPEIGEYLEDYNNSAFWDELTHRLSLRALQEHYGEEGVQKMDNRKRMMLIGQLEEKLNEEFVKNNLNNLHIKLPLQTPVV